MHIYIYQCYPHCQNCTLFHADRACGHAGILINTTAHRPTRFAWPKSNQTARLQRIPEKTKQDTKYCVKLWNEWRMNRTATTGEHISTIEQMTDTELTHWMSRFVLEVRKVNGSEYPPNSIHHICAGLLRYLRMSGRDIDLFKDTAFAPF